MSLTNKDNWFTMTSFDEFAREIDKKTSYAISPYTDGFAGWACKRDLILLKYYIEEKLSEFSNYGSDEDKLIKELEEKKLIEILSR
jgi:hypothetical protein